MAEFPSLPLWTDAYLADTKHLTTIEHGAYLLLLMCMWRSKGSLPNDDKLLARYAGLTKGQWTRIKPAIFPFFTVSPDSISQRRLTKELGFVRQRSIKASDAAKAKWLKNKETGDANAQSEQCERNAPTPIDSSSLRSEGLTPIIPQPKSNEKFDAFWSLYPNKVGKRDAEKKFALALKRVSFDDLMAGLRRYVGKTDDRAWCNPSTWLNQDRWADAPAQAQPRQGQRQASTDPARPRNVGELARQRLRQRMQNDETAEHTDRHDNPGDRGGQGNGFEPVGQLALKAIGRRD